jgi:NAD(P)-dependent dehydrogenase (short-subunit alcohol dehydrogenase family)
LKPLKSTSALDFLDAYKLNTLGAALALKHLAPALAGGTSPGSVVLYSTVAAGTGFPNHTAIATAKGGIEALARSAAAELSPKVRINVVSPSLTDTPLASRMTSSEAMRKSLGDAHPIPRLGTPEDLSAMTCFLLDNEQSGWISGQTFAVDGGRSTLRPKN